MFHKRYNIFHKSIITRNGDHHLQRTVWSKAIRSPETLVTDNTTARRHNADDSNEHIHRRAVKTPNLKKNGVERGRCAVGQTDRQTIATSRWRHASGILTEDRNSDRPNAEPKCSQSSTWSCHEVQWRWSCGSWRRVDSSVDAKVSEKHNVSAFSLEDKGSMFSKSTKEPTWYQEPEYHQTHSSENLESHK
jgi:hypothetical protein